MAKPHPQNVEGPFYVEDGCCTSCDVPRSFAPELFKYTEDNHCFIYRQPQTPEELEKMFQVLETQEMMCIRCRSRDPALLKQLRKRRLESVCDMNDVPISRRLRRWLLPVLSTLLVTIGTIGACTWGRSGDERAGAAMALAFFWFPISFLLALCSAIITWARRKTWPRTDKVIGVAPFILLSAVVLFFLVVTFAHWK
ncbi:MAG: hypothetical protein C5B50_07750 [Verrucomicrobia bacterium]|nr:MAG: hypothetical protein C5B50_07750 [Verrucomicrobiota bacterium]